MTEDNVVRAVKVNIAVLVTPEREIRFTKQVAKQLPIHYIQRTEMGFNKEPLHKVIAKVPGKVVDNSVNNNWYLLVETEHGLAWERPFEPLAQYNLQGDDLNSIPTIIL